MAVLYLIVRNNILRCQFIHSSTDYQLRKEKEWLATISKETVTVKSLVNQFLALNLMPEYRKWYFRVSRCQDFLGAHAYCGGHRETCEYAHIQLNALSHWSSNWTSTKIRSLTGTEWCLAARASAWEPTMDLNLREKYRKTKLRNKNENKTSDRKNIKKRHFKGSMPSFSISRIHYNFENYLLSVNLKLEFLPFICFCCYCCLLLFCSVLPFLFFSFVYQLLLQWRVTYPPSAITAWVPMNTYNTK